MSVQCRQHHNAVRRQVRARVPCDGGGERLHFSRRTRGGERVYSRNCAFHVLLISSASYTECALDLARANDGQTAGPSNEWSYLINDRCGSASVRDLDGLNG